MSGYFRMLNRPDYVTTQTLASEIVKDLTLNGFSVINNFLDTEAMNDIRSELTGLCRSNRFFPGKLCQAGANTTSSIRGDVVRWLDVKHDCPYTAVHEAVKRMDRITSVLNASKILRGCDIRSRSPAMIAYYPANSNGYKQHVDNPNQDGRKLTFILYANREYDRLRDGGVLRIHKSERRLYFDVEPLDGRLVIFWSDSRTPHEVLPTNSERCAISLWYFDLIERARTLVKMPASKDRSMMETCFLSR